MWWWHDNWGWGAWLAMTATMLVVWALGIGALVSLLRSNSGARRRPTPEDVLAERFPRGEIDEEEYRKRRELLRTGA